jgi:hypothetical protein
MKKYIILSLISFSAFAGPHDIEGTMVLKGSLKSKVSVNGVETTCRAEIKKVKNIIEEDSYGNPGYQVNLRVSLDGKDDKRKITIKADQDVIVKNFFQTGTTVEARDLSYADSASGVSMEIAHDGRIKSVKQTYQGSVVNCLF